MNQLFISFSFSLVVMFSHVSAAKTSLKNATHPRNEKRNFKKVGSETSFNRSAITKLSRQHIRPKNLFIHDEFTARRGCPKMLNICCNHCNYFILTYQKDGPGRLLRCYLDRVHAPKKEKDKQYKHFDVKRFPKLTCTNCKFLIGYPMLYYSENRPAYKMLKGRSYFHEV